jgi:hypothetical protein
MMLNLNCIQILSNSFFLNSFKFRGSLNIRNVLKGKPYEPSPYTPFFSYENNIQLMKIKKYYIVI